MKRIVIMTAAALCLFVPGACNRTASRVEAVAESFLKAYYADDKAAMSSLCTPAFAAWMQENQSQVVLPEKTERIIKEALSRTSFKIVSVEVDEKGASARVCYEIKVPYLDKPVPKALKLQLEGRTALVDGIE